MSAGRMEETRAAASSIARGIPSSRRQISETDPTFEASSAKPGRAIAARSTKRRTAALAAVSSRRPSGDGTGSERSGQTCSPSSARPSRLVAITRTAGQRWSRLPARRAVASSRCSQLSRTRSAVRARRNSITHSSSEAFARGCTPSVTATSWTTPSSSLTPASSLSQTPSGNSGAMSAADLHREARLADPAHADEGHERRLGQGLGDRDDFLLATDERRELAGKVAGKRVERLQRRKVRRRARARRAGRHARCARGRGGDVRRGRAATRRPGARRGQAPRWRARARPGHRSPPTRASRRGSPRCRSSRRRALRPGRCGCPCGPAADRSRPRPPPRARVARPAPPGPPTWTRRTRRARRRRGSSRRGRRARRSRRAGSRRGAPRRPASPRGTPPRAGWIPRDR